MLNNKKARYSHFRYCGYGCCGPAASKKQQKRILRKVEKRAWKRQANGEQ